MRSALLYIVKSILLIAIYYNVNNLAFKIVPDPFFAVPLWPSAGIAIGWVILWGYRYLPSVFIGGFLFNLFTHYSDFSTVTLISLLSLTALSATYALQTWTGAYLVKRFIKLPTALQINSDIFKLLLLGGGIACLVGGIIGSTILSIHKEFAVNELFISIYTWWIGDFVGVILFTPLMLLIFSKEVTLTRKITVAITTFLICSLTIIIFAYSNNTEMLHAQERVREISSLHENSIKDNIKLKQRTLLSIRNFFGASENVSREEFKVFIGDTMKDNPALLGLVWVPRIKHKDKEAYEKSVQQEGFSDFRIKELDGNKLIPVKKRAEYFPVGYIEPFLGENRRAFGFDEGSNLKRSVAMKKAIKTNKQVATEKITLVIKTRKQNGFITFDPIYEYDKPIGTIKQRTQNLKGFALGAFLNKELIESSIKNIEYQNINLHVEYRDSQNEKHILYGQKIPVNDFSHTATIDVAGQEWFIIHTPNNTFIKQNLTWNMKLLTTGELIFVLLLITFLLIASIESDTIKYIPKKEKNNSLFIIPIISTIITVTLTINLWSHINVSEETIIHNTLDREKIIAQQVIKDVFDTSFAALKRMAHRWEISKGTEHTEWHSDAANYISDINPLVSIKWIDTDFKARWNEDDGNKILEYTLDKEKIKLLNEASIKKTPIIIYNLYSSQQFGHFTVFVPIKTKKKSYGFLAGTYDINKLMRSTAFDSFNENLRINIYDKETIVYLPDFNSYPNKHLLSHIQKFSIPIFNKMWSVEVWPENKFFTKHKTLLPENILVGGVLMSILIGLSLYYAMFARWRSMLLCKATHDLKESETQYRAVVDNTIDGLITINTKGTIKTFNPASEKIFGYKAKEIIGENISKLIPNSFAKENIESYDSCNISGQKEAVGSIAEVQGKRKNSRLFPLDLAINELILPNKERLFTAILRDITKRKKTENELQSAKEKAEESTQLKSEFLANMSHEIRTPMNGVIGMTNLLLETKLSSKQNMHAQTILSSANSLLTILNDILDFSKIEAGKLQLEAIPFDMQLLIEDVADIMAVRCREKGIEMLLRYSPDTARYMLGDPGRIRQIMINLLSNAVKFTNIGHVIIDIESQTLKSGKVEFKIKIIDSGIGIDKERIDYIFNKFNQGDQSTTRKFGGTGLGLSICTQLIDIMDGHIDVESTLKKGSIFWFTIQLDPSNEVTIEKISYKQNALNGVKILIIDDSDIAITILKEQLDSLNMNVKSSSSAKEGLRLLKEAAETKTPYEIVITDQCMPVMDGEELGKKIKDNPKLKNTLMVMLTSAPKKGEGQKLKEIGFDAYITKPTHPSEVPQILNILWDAKKTNKQIKLITRDTLGETVKKGRPELKIKNARILLAEDNIVNQMVAEQVLENVGCKVITADNGIEAIDFYKQQPFDFIFMDCQMPEVDGYDASLTIRKYESDNDMERTPIVAFTANVMPGDREKCIKAGMDDYVGKPVKPETIEAMLIKWLPKEKISIKTTDKA